MDLLENGFLKDAILSSGILLDIKERNYVSLFYREQENWNLRELLLEFSFSLISTDSKPGNDSEPCYGSPIFVY